MSPPASERAERITRDVPITPHVAPLCAARTAQRAVPTYQPAVAHPRPCKVGTSRCDVPARVRAGGTNHARRANYPARCAALRGADGAARRPYLSTGGCSPSPLQGRDIALRCPRPRQSGRNELRATCQLPRTLRRSARRGRRSAASLPINLRLLTLAPSDGE